MCGDEAREKSGVWGSSRLDEKLPTFTLGNILRIL